MAENYDPLGDAIKLLIGERPEKFPLERPLRLFQFRTWLVDHCKEARSFRDGGFIFTLLESRRIERSRRKQRAAPSQRLVQSINSDRLRPLFDATLERYSLLGLALTAWAPLRERDIHADRLAIEHLNELTRCRLRLHHTAGIEPSRNNGLLVMNALCPETPGMNKRPGVTKVKKIRRARRVRESFLFAARDFELIWQFPEDRSITDAYSNLLKIVSIQAQDVEYLRSYFAYVKALMAILDDEAAKHLNLFWAQLPVASIPYFEPLTSEELDIAGLKPRVRRSAEITKKATRQSTPGDVTP
jgi:hypothetical protein